MGRQMKMMKNGWKLIENEGIPHFALGIITNIENT